MAKVSFKIKSRRRKSGLTCRETCQGQEWGLASFPDTILSAMFGLKWAIPQSFGQSGRKEETSTKINKYTRINIFQMGGNIFSSEVAWGVFLHEFALTQVEELVLRLASPGQRVCGCRRWCLAQEQRQQQRQKGEQRRSRYGHRLTQNHRQAHVSRYLYQAASTCRCTCTGTHTARTHARTHTTAHNNNNRPSAGLFSCSYEFPLLLRKKGYFRESHQHFHILHI